MNDTLPTLEVDSVAERKQRHAIKGTVITAVVAPVVLVITLPIPFGVTAVATPAVTVLAHKYLSQFLGIMRIENSLRLKILPFHADGHQSLSKEGKYGRLRLQGVALMNMKKGGRPKSAKVHFVMFRKAMRTLAADLSDGLHAEVEHFGSTIPNHLASIATKLGFDCHETDLDGHLFALIDRESLIDRYKPV